MTRVDLLDGADQALKSIICLREGWEVADYPTYNFLCALRVSTEAGQFFHYDTTITTKGGGHWPVTHAIIPKFEICRSN